MFTIHLILKEENSIQKPEIVGDVEGGPKKGKVIKFGWIEGVYVSTQQPV